MNPFVYVHDLSPFIVKINVWGHDVGLRWYGLAYAVGFGLAYVTLRRAASSGAVRGLDARGVEALLWAIVVGVLVGGRAGFLVQHVPELRVDPLYAFRVWEGGMTFFGGLLGLVLGILIVARRRGLDLNSLLDALAPPFALSLGLGRLANFVNGELVGQPTDGTWGVIFPQVDALPRHPSQLYEALSHFVLFGILVAVRRAWPGWSGKHAGRVWSLFLLLYGLLRALTDTFRADDTYWGALSSGQWASLAVAACGAGLLWRQTRDH